MTTNTSGPHDDDRLHVIDASGTPTPNPDHGSYADRVDSESVADLDAGVPELRTQEFRRLNRRAIVFLLAIVLLLTLLAATLYRSATAPRVAPKPRADTLVVPELPRVITAAPAPKKPPVSTNPALMPPLPPAMPASPIPVVPTTLKHRQPSLVERRGMPPTGNSIAIGAVGAAGSPAQDPDSLPASRTHAARAESLSQPETLLLRGTFIRCVLQTRIISDIPGFTSCVVAEPVYSFDGARLLLPKGSKVFGAYDRGPVGERIAIVWDRIVTPDGVNVDMASPGVDNLGGAGYEGDIDSHWRSRIGAAVLISLMSDAFLYEGAKHGPKSNSIGQGGIVVQEPFQSNTAETLQNLANQAVQRSANRQPTLTISQGSNVSIYVAKDVDFSGVASRL